MWQAWRDPDASPSRDLNCSRQSAWQSQEGGLRHQNQRSQLHYSFLANARLKQCSAVGTETQAAGVSGDWIGAHQRQPHLTDLASESNSSRIRTKSASAPEHHITVAFLHNTRPPRNQKVPRIAPVITLARSQTILFLFE